MGPVLMLVKPCADVDSPVAARRPGKSVGLMPPMAIPCVVTHTCIGGNPSAMLLLSSAITAGMALARVGAKTYLASRDEDPQQSLL